MAGPLLGLFLFKAPSGGSQAEMSCVIGLCYLDPWLGFLMASIMDSNYRLSQAEMSLYCGLYPWAGPPGWAPILVGSTYGLSHWGRMVAVYCKLQSSMALENTMVGFQRSSI